MSDMISAAQQYAVLSVLCCLCSVFKLLWVYKICICAYLCQGHCAL